MIAKTCKCGRRVTPGTKCACGAGSQAERMRRQPWRQVYRLASYRKNRAARYLLVDGWCEVCRVPLRGKLHPDGVPWECDHRTEARHFLHDLDAANAIENLECRCVPCHREKTRGA